VKSHTTRRFRAALAELPKEIQRQARQAYRLFQENPYHPSLRFKRIHPLKPIYSVRISLGYRAVGVLTGQEVVWFWVGSHADYDRLLAGL
jgi:mRNA-degrading endonuclease RelE of RelBE toxin-antitoxin system